ncbi:MAG: hypothetical protein RQ723_12890 [Desulfuromonadales bacterium]|nr:hypothetical protein [Desulfuromonadales bacterium]
MILRRVIEHVREQNWFAVSIDFLIVIVGVFIGIQVANWNDARRDREAEALYLDRLQQELSEISPQAAASHASVRAELERVMEVRDYFLTGEGLDSFGGEHCAAIVTSHIYAGTIFYPPTIKELISTGRIVLIQDHAIRTAILSFDQTNAELSQLRTDIQIDRMLLARAHPELIDAGLTDWEDAVCDFEAMSGDRAFLNDFLDNMRRFSAYVSDVEGRQSEVIESLRATIESGAVAAYTPDTDASAASEMK